MWMNMQMKVKGETENRRAQEEEISTFLNHLIAGSWTERPLT
jgi:hypothetical protein